MNERHDPSACRRILRSAKENGLSRDLLDAAQELRDGVYRAEALCGLCRLSEMEDEDRREWVPIIVDSMLEEERSWRLAESIGIVAKSASKWPKGAARKTMIENLISLTGGLPTGKDRVDALKSISSRVSDHHIPELMLLAIENQGLEAKAARPVIKAMVQTKNHDMINQIMPLLTEGTPDLSVRLLDSLHRISTQEKLQIQPSALEMALPHLNGAEFETVRTMCSNARSLHDVKLLAEALHGSDERAIRFAVTLAGRADRAGDAGLAQSLLDEAAKNLNSIEVHLQGNIAKNIAKGFERLGLHERAAEIKPVRTPSIISTKVVNADTPRKGHTLALVGTYEGSIGTPHLRALARAAGIAWGFGLDIALIDWPTKDLEGLCIRAVKESGTAGVNHLAQLLEAERVVLSSSEDALGGSLGHPIVTTHQPRGGSVDLTSFEGSLCVMIGLGRNGLPGTVLEACDDQFELTGIGASLETAVAMGAIAQCLSNLN